MREFNCYPALEKEFGEMAFETNKRDMELINKITERNNKVIEELSKKPRKEKKNGK